MKNNKSYKTSTRKKEQKKKFNAVQGNETLKQKKNKKEKNLKLSKLPSC